MSYTCMCISAGKKSAISSFLRGGSLDFQTKWHLAVNRKGICSRRYQHLQLTWTSSFWGLQMCPLRQNVGFDVLFTYHEINVCISFSFKSIEARQGHGLTHDWPQCPLKNHCLVLDISRSSYLCCNQRMCPREEWPCPKTYIMILGLHQ